jgi:hypothetical protein
MKSAMQLVSTPVFGGMVVLIVCCFVLPNRLEAQNAQGQNAVCSSPSVCSSSSNTVGTNAFIDASMFAPQHLDFCDTIYNIIKPSSYSVAAVIDARGINSTNSNLSCTHGSPWSEGSSYVNKPSVILLPAGTITTYVPWVVPTNTKLIGIATGPGNNNLLDTTLQASNSFTSAAIVQFGDSHCPSSVCQGISVEHLSINGGVSGNVFNGIENDNCGLLCYVDHVNMYQVLGTGLNVSGTNASDSGPYSNITFDVGSSTSSSTHCAHIEGTNGTRGIHGMTCIASPDATSGL